MTKPIEYGVFLPVGSGGWIASSTVPTLDASYSYNREVTRLADDLGFDFSLSQAVWRGYGGTSQHFDVNLESLTTAAGLAEATERIGVWSTVNTAMLHPAIAAKMVATNDQISGGRTALNIVAGGNRVSEHQMGLGVDLDNAGKYARATEWVEIIKALWTEKSVDYDGEYFTLDDCQSDPKPLDGVPQMICAATSDAGLEFVAKNLDGVLFEGTSRDSVVEIGQRARRTSEKHGDRLKSYCVFMVIPGDTDADADRRIKHYLDGRDDTALANMAKEWGMVYKDQSGKTADNEDWANSLALSTGTVSGSPETISEQLADMIEHADLDGAVFIMPDFIGDLRVLGEEILPTLAKNGFAQDPQKSAGALA